MLYLRIGMCVVGAVVSLSCVRNVCLTLILQFLI